MDIEQQIIDRSVDIATSSALNDHPIEKVIHIPCQSATDDPIGCFVVIPYES